MAAAHPSHQLRQPPLEVSCTLTLDQCRHSSSTPRQRPCSSKFKTIKPCQKGIHQPYLTVPRFPFIDCVYSILRNLLSHPRNHTHDRDIVGSAIVLITDIWDQEQITLRSLINASKCHLPSAQWVSGFNELFSVLLQSHCQSRYITRTVFGRKENVRPRCPHIYWVEHECRLSYC